MGEAASLQRLEQEGFTDIISQVSFRSADGTEFRADFVARSPKGEIIAVEAKTGRHAVVTPNQAVGYPELNKEGAVVNTNKLLRGYGFRKGTTVQMRVEIDHWGCPTCGS
jgi:hypothetical protein